MKKITLFMAFVACAMFAGAQNLVQNPSFETWESGAPAPWYVVSASVTGSVVSQDAAIFTDGAKSFKVDAAGASGTVNWSQGVSIVGGKTYTLTMSYYIASGDGTDARIWSNFKTGATFMSEADLIATGLYPKLRGPGAANNQGTEYFPDVRNTWKTYTVDFTAPAGVDAFDFQFRTYKGAVVYWDKMSLTEKVTGLSTPTASKLELIVSGKNLLVKNVAEGAEVEIFSAVGSKVQTSAVENGKVSIANLKGGMYVVRSGKLTQKIML